MDKVQEKNITENNSQKKWISPELISLDVSKTYEGSGASLEDMTSYASP